MNQPDPAARQIEIGGLAVQFHEAYERLAPSFGWITQAESAVEWRDLPGRQKRLMEAVVSEVVGPLLAALATAEEERDEAEKFLGHALTCAMYGLREVDWAAVEHFLRRNEDRANYSKATGPQAENEGAENA